MFDGERIVMQKERLTCDRKFLLRNGAVPIPRASFEIPLITRESPRREVKDAAEGIFEDMLGHIDIRIPHELYFPYRRQWEPSDARTTMEAFDALCDNLHAQMKAFDVSREMFGFRTTIYPIVFPWGRKNRNVLIADITSGISTRLGDGQRYHDGHQWSFSQMKGLRTHTGHLYVRGSPT